MGTTRQIPGAPGETLRPRTEKNRRQHEATLLQVPAGELKSHLEFLRHLPVHLDLGSCRVVHACWHEPSIAVVEEARSRHGGLTEEFLIEGYERESPLYAAIEVLLKGPEFRLPPGHGFLDKDGHSREEIRVRWFSDPIGKTLGRHTLPEYRALDREPVPSAVAASWPGYPRSAPPVFFGHYWLEEDHPELLEPNVACLDYSVAKGGFLCAYRRDAENPLDVSRFRVASAVHSSTAAQRPQQVPGS